MAAIVVAFSVARTFLVPATFGQYGWYRGKAIDEIRVTPITFAGREACAECHEDQVKKKAGSKHKNIGCESCHGANVKHAEDPMQSPEKITNPRFCLRCHEANPARPPKFPQIDSKDHYNDTQKCAACHQPHAPTEAPAK